MRKGSETVNWIIKEIPWKRVGGKIVAIITIVGGIYVATKWVEGTAREAVLDEKFLATLAVRAGNVYFR